MENRDCGKRKETKNTIQYVAIKPKKQGSNKSANYTIL